MVGGPNWVVIIVFLLALAALAGGQSWLLAKHRYWVISMTRERARNTPFTYGLDKYDDERLNRFLDRWGRVSRFLAFFFAISGVVLLIVVLVALAT